MASDDKFTLQEKGVSLKQYELLNDQTGSAHLSEKTRLDNIAYDLIQKQKQELDIASAKAEVTQLLYIEQGKILSEWIQNGAIGEIPATFSWLECDARANEMINAARSRDIGEQDAQLHPELVEKINLAAGAQNPIPENTMQTDPDFRLEADGDIRNYTLIEPDQVISPRQKIVRSGVIEKAKRTYTAIRHPKETLASIKSQRQVEKILKAESIDYEETLRSIRSEIGVAKDIVIAAIREMSSNIESHGPHDLCELIATASRLAVTLPDETRLCIRDSLLDLIQHGHTDKAVDFINELRLSNKEDCSQAIDALSKDYPDNENITLSIGILRNTLNASNQETITDVSDATPPEPLDGGEFVPEDQALVDNPIKEVEERVSELLDDQTDPVTVAGPYKEDVADPMDQTKIEEKLVDLLDNQTDTATKQEIKVEASITPENLQNADSIRNVVAKKLQETSVSDLGQALDELRQNYPDYRDMIDNTASDAVVNRAREIATSQETSLDEIKNILDSLYDNGLISAKNRNDVFLDYSESHRKAVVTDTGPEPKDDEHDAVKIEENQKLKTILSASTPLSEEEIALLRKYKKESEKEPHRYIEVMKAITERVIAPLLVEGQQDHVNYANLQKEYTNIRDMIKTMLISQADVLRSLEHSLYEIVTSNSNITSRVRKRMLFLKTLISNFSSGNMQFVDSMKEQDKKQIDRQVLLRGVISSDSEDNLQKFVEKYTKSLSKDSRLNPEDEKELEAVIRIKKDLLRNKAIGEALQLCKGMTHDFSEKLFDLLKNRKDIPELAETICEKLLEDNSHDVIVAFVSALKEKYLINEYSLFMLINVLVSRSVTNEIKIRNLRNSGDDFRIDLIKALFANSQLRIGLSDAINITTETLRVAESEDMASRFLVSCKSIGVA